MSFPRTIIGLGTGRSGTWSLTKLLDAQHGVKAYHEGGFLPWDANLTDMWRLLHKFWYFTEGRPITAAIAFFWLNYVSELTSYLFNPKFICIKRNRKETVESFEHIMHEFNFWTDPNSKHWDDKYRTNKDSVLFPKFDKPRRKALEAYWNYYYNTAGYWQNRMPDTFRVFPIESLNNEKGVREILEFAGFEDPVVHVGVRLNTRENPRGNIE